MSILWPRLDRALAEPLLASLVDARGRPVAGELRHPAQTYASSGGARATPDDLARLREGILDVATAYGFPDDQSRAIEFDRALAPRLLTLMPMSTGEALTKPVWSFTSLVVAPDVTYWRFVDPRREWNVERWVCSDRTRHMFARLWWQARQLTIPTPDGLDTRLLDGLTESELNHLTERISIGGCAPLVRAMAGAVLDLPARSRHRDVVRNGALRLLRLVAVVDPFSLDDAQLAALAGHALDEAVAVLLPDPQGLRVELPAPPGVASP